MDTQEVKRRRCPNGHPESKEEGVQMDTWKVGRKVWEKLKLA